MFVSMRQAGHWPQDSLAKKSAIRTTSSTTESSSVRTLTTPHPMDEPASRKEA